MHSWLRGATFGVVLSLTLGAVALLQAGGQGGQDRVGRLEQEVLLLSRRVEALEKCIGETPRTAYAGIGKSSPLRSIQQFGKRIALTNGSNWDVAERDRNMVRRWRAADEIMIEWSRNKDFPYALLNRRTDEVAEAQYVGALKFGGS